MPSCRLRSDYEVPKGNIAEQLHSALLQESTKMKTLLIMLNGAPRTSKSDIGHELPRNFVLPDETEDGSSSRDCLWTDFCDVERSSIATAPQQMSNRFRNTCINKT